MSDEFFFYFGLLDSCYIELVINLYVFGKKIMIDYIGIYFFFFKMFIFYMFDSVNYELVVLVDFSF